MSPTFLRSIFEISKKIIKIFLEGMQGWALSLRRIWCAHHHPVPEISVLATLRDLQMPCLISLLSLYYCGFLKSSYLSVIFN